MLPTKELVVASHGAGAALTGGAAEPPKAVGAGPAGASGTRRNRSLSRRVPVPSVRRQGPASGVAPVGAAHGGGETPVRALGAQPVGPGVMDDVV
ncbi:hypothetical protein GCM10010293_10520 [Streptomyces griseoflavus]|nr:hypothetical protein GCM10010293_10520 [Streptomyces griseoflavus]